jgi:putative glycerol-1-phosphate prenyltransferase
MGIFEKLSCIISERGAAYLLLIDPDKISGEDLTVYVKNAESSGVDGFLVGGSLMMKGDIYNTICAIKDNTSLPAIIFPGSVDQITSNADALLYISLISGRNAEHLIGKHVLAAPIIKKYNIEPISTGYMLVDSGNATTAEYISGSKPIPRNKPEIAAATALAAQYLGMKMVYLEAGSGAAQSVPDEMIKMVSGFCDIPVIVGGGIRDAASAKRKVESGAKIIVTGNFFENKNNWTIIKEFADSIHYKG